MLSCRYKNVSPFCPFPVLFILGLYNPYWPPSSLWTPSFAVSSLLIIHPIKWIFCLIFYFQYFHFFNSSHVVQFLYTSCNILIIVILKSLSDNSNSWSIPVFASINCFLFCPWLTFSWAFSYLNFYCMLQKTETENRTEKTFTLKISCHFFYEDFCLEGWVLNL